MAASLEQVASQRLSVRRREIVEALFGNGPHEAVLVLGYSGSDVFDISPAIERIGRTAKTVWFIQHAEEARVEPLQQGTKNNPFTDYSDGGRIHVNTDQFVERLWSELLPRERYALRVSQTYWETHVDQWYSAVVRLNGKAAVYGVMSMLLRLTGHVERAIVYAREFVDLVAASGDEGRQAIAFIGECQTAAERSQRRSMNTESQIDASKSTNSGTTSSASETGSIVGSRIANVSIST